MPWHLKQSLILVKFLCIFTIFGFLLWQTLHAEAGRDIYRNAAADTTAMINDLNCLMLQF